MQVSIETTTGLERRMTVGVPAEKVDSEVESRLQKAARTVRMAGFRPGKVPLRVVRQRFGEGVRAEVIGEIMNQSLYEAIVQEKIQPAGQPTVEARQTAPGRDLEFVATFEVYPEVSLGDLSRLKIERPTAEVTEADIDHMIEVFRGQQGTWENVARAAALDDQVNIDFDGTIDGEAFEGGSGTSTDLVLGSGRMIEGFEDGIVGMKGGADKTLDLTFPENYHKEELRGRPVKFTVKVNSVSERKPAQLDDAFFARYGVTEGGEPRFREEVRKNMERELNQAITNRVKQQVMDQLLDIHEIQLPQALVSGEIDALRRQAFQQFGQMPQNIDESILPDDLFREQAERRVALGLILREVITKGGIKADPARVRAAVEDLASTYQEPEEVVNYYYSNKELLGSIETAVLEDQVVDAIIDDAGIDDISMSYEQVLKPAEKDAEAQAEA